MPIDWMNPPQADPRDVAVLGGFGLSRPPRTIEDRALGFPLSLLSQPPAQQRQQPMGPDMSTDWGLAGMDPFGRPLPSQNPMMQMQVQQQVAALRNQMQQQEQMRYGMPGQQDPQVGAMMQELESRLGGGPQWRDTTGLGGRMSRLPMPQEQQAPQGPQQDPGLLMQALQLAARNNSFPDTVPEMLSGQGSAMRNMDGGDGRTAAQHGWPGATQGRQVLDRNSQIPLSEEPWFDAYVAAGQGGADLPTISGGGATESPDMLARRAAHREARIKNERAGLLPMEERRANVRTNAINKSAARHDRMGISDSAPQYDLLRRLQGMEGGDDPMGGVAYLRNRMMGGPQFAGAAFDGAQKSALLDQEQQGRAATEQAKLMYAAAISVLQDATASPQRKQEAWNFVMQNGGGAGGGAAPALPPLTGKTPGEALDNRWTPGVDEDTLRKQWEYENPGGAWGNPTPLPPGQTQGPRVIQPSLLDILRRLEFPEAGIAF